MKESQHKEQLKNFLIFKIFFEAQKGVYELCIIFPVVYQYLHIYYITYIYNYVSTIYDFSIFVINLCANLGSLI